jgi:hypothetical protein
MLKPGLRQAMLPTITQMRSPPTSKHTELTSSVIGLVSIPGMMTGAILGGASISQAVKYQQIIMFLISATTTLAVTMSVVICMVVTLDGTHRLRPDRVSGEKPWMWRIRDNAAWGIWRGCRAAWYKLTCQGHILHEEEEQQQHVENGTHH